MKLLSFIVILIHLCLLNTVIADELDSLSTEQKVKTYFILSELEKNLYDSEIILNFSNEKAKSYDIQTLKSKLVAILDTETLKTKDKMFSLSILDMKTKKIDNPKINFFSKINGKRFASFQCKSIKIGKMLIGPFEIPANKIIVDQPEITYYW